MTNSAITDSAMTNPPGPHGPAALSHDFAALLSARKSDFVSGADDDVTISQHGAATIAMDRWPGWPSALEAAGQSATEPIIETFVAGADRVMATSDNEPFVAAWTPLIGWLNLTVRSALRTHGVELDGDAYATASLTATELLEGTAHMDDDTFVPAESVSVVAIVGQLAGPRIATGSLAPQPLRAMSQVTWHDSQLRAFEADQIEHCACDADQLVIFPQFGQLHAGPAASHIARLASTRQLLVYRAKVQ